MPNNHITDAALAELDRQYGRAESETGTKIDLAVAMNAAYLAYPALRQRLLAAESRLADVERERDVYHAALSEIYYRAIPMNEDSGHSTIAHIAADAMRGNNGNPLADRDAQQRREGAADELERLASSDLELREMFLTESQMRLRAFSHAKLADELRKAAQRLREGK